MNTRSLILAPGQFLLSTGRCARGPPQQAGILASWLLLLRMFRSCSTPSKAVRSQYEPLSKLQHVKRCTYLFLGLFLSLRTWYVSFPAEVWDVLIDWFAVVLQCISELERIQCKNEIERMNRAARSG